MFQVKLSKVSKFPKQAVLFSKVWNPPVIIPALHSTLLVVNLAFKLDFVQLSGQLTGRV